MTEQKTLYLHIGMPKTGTSSLQEFLKQNENMLLQHGYCYPDIPVRYPLISPVRNAHFLTVSVSEKEDTDGKAETERKKTQAFQALQGIFKIHDRVILSDEAIWNTFSAETPESLRDICVFCGQNQIALRVLVWLRRQDFFLESYWKQKIRRRGAVWKWNRMLRNTPEYIMLDYDRHLREIAAEAGKDCLVVRAYREERFDLCRDFLRAVGIRDMQGFLFPEQRMNESLNNNYAEIKRILNQILAEECRQEECRQEEKWLERIAVNCSRAEKKQYQSTMFSEKTRKRFLRQYESGNQNIASVFMGGESLFDGDAPELPQWSVQNPLQYEDTVLFFGRALLEQRRQIQEIQRAMARAGRWKRIFGKMHLLQRK